MAVIHSQVHCYTQAALYWLYWLVILVACFSYTFERVHYRDVSSARWGETDDPSPVVHMHTWHPVSVQVTYSLQIAEKQQRLYPPWSGIP
jgi:hypothetical protein